MRMWELLKHSAIRVNQRDVRGDGEEGWSALQCCLASQAPADDARFAALKELLKHPSLDRGDMRAALQEAQGQSRLSRFAWAIAEAL